MDDYAVDPVLRNDRGLIYRLLVKDRRVEQIELLPVFISKCQVNVATGSDRDAIIQRIRSLSSEMGAAVQTSDERLWIDCPLWADQLTAQKC